MFIVYCIITQFIFNRFNWSSVCLQVHLQLDESVKLLEIWNLVFRRIFNIKIYRILIAVTDC